MQQFISDGLPVVSVDPKCEDTRTYKIIQMFVVFIEYSDCYMMLVDHTLRCVCVCYPWHPLHPVRPWSCAGEDAGFPTEHVQMGAPARSHASPALDVLSLASFE